MRSRKWISVLALLGVLLHAGAIARHNAAMTGATFQYQALLTGLAQLCHGSDDGRTPRRGRTSLRTEANGCAERLPDLLGAEPRRLRCSAPELDVVFACAPVAIAFHPDARCAPDSGHAVCPPARGPPAAA